MRPLRRDIALLVGFLRGRLRTRRRWKQGGSIGQHRGLAHHDDGRGRATVSNRFGGRSATAVPASQGLAAARWWCCRGLTCLKRSRLDAGSLGTSAFARHCGLATLCATATSQRDTRSPAQQCLSGSTSPRGFIFTLCIDERRWYKGVPPRTRMIVGVAVMGYAAAAMFVTDRVEEKIGLAPTEKDREDLQKAMPRITVVDRPSK
jgi:hypothetical protein